MNDKNIRKSIGGKQLEINQKNQASQVKSECNKSAEQVRSKNLVLSKIKLDTAKSTEHLVPG